MLNTQYIHAFFALRATRGARDTPRMPQSRGDEREC